MASAYTLVVNVIAKKVVIDDDDSVSDGNDFSYKSFIKDLLRVSVFRCITYHK